MKNEIFSEEALSRLRSPEQLDALLKITQPTAWMGLLMLLMLCASIVLWSIYGVLSVSVDAVGMIVDPAGVVNVFHDASGRVSEILVSPGMRVRKGDLLAKVANPSLASDMIMSRQNILYSGNMQQVESSLSNFDSIANKMYLSSEVRSPYEGIVIEVDINPGDLITAGQSVVCAIRQNQDRDDIVAVMYVPVDMGKKIAPGMVVQISPSGVDTKKDGYLMGVVREMSVFPASTASMTKTLANINLVNWILDKMQGAAMEARVDLVKDEKSSSGYLWSSIVGERPKITVGNVCTGRVVVERTPPLEKAFLKLSQWLRNS
ncbi:MAG: HlyD family efflux transporter periplasmic adaptor subunit [Synergistaceae bacterium]|jgi:multidrug efflux pump subunit AcrA (membrane-fusion protein)|nr:HlyD family efflux transporter periplasmic adaptor subunit [Synergistaceae bacterium]